LGACALDGATTELPGSAAVHCSAVSTWRDGLDGDGAWLSLVGEVSPAEFLASAGTDDVREACRAHAVRLPEMFPDEIPEVSDADVTWVTDTLAAYAEADRAD